MRLRAKDPFSCFSHLLGLLFAIPGLAWLILQAHGDPLRTLGFAVYGSSLVVLYGASTLYHWAPVAPHRHDLLRRFDHSAIYLLIAGTYTPVCLIVLRGQLGWALFILIWAGALAGAVVKLFFRHLPRGISTGLYLAIGSTGVVALVPLARALPIAGLSCLLLGSLFYTVGAVIYGTQRPNPFPQVFGFHDIFHLFVLAGSAMHFLFMLRYVAPAA